MWDERGEELMLQIPLKAGQSSRDVSCEFRPWHLSVAITPNGPKFGGELRGKVRSDDCHWIIEDEGGERVLQIMLAKAGSFSRWGGVFAEDE